jgi:hypothetical protein
VVERISGLPARVKTAKAFDANQLVVFRRKGLGLFIQNVNDTNEKIPEVQSSLLEEGLACVQCLPEEPRLDLSERFWSCYEAIKADKGTQRVTKSELSLEVKAQNNLQSALRFYEKDLDPYLPFIRTLIKDLREYKTLSKFTLRRLTSVDLIPNDQKALGEFIKEIAFVRAHLGEDYLDIIQGRLGSMKSEIIIAVENQQPQNTSLPGEELP